MVRSCRTWCCRDWRSSRRSRVRRMFRPGPRNLITDIPTLTVGHASDENARSGVTALLCGAAWADGVTAALSARGIGLQLRPGSPPIPIVPSAVLHDLGNGGDKNWGLTPPYRDLGIRALNAGGSDFALGSVGAGRGGMA